MRYGEGAMLPVGQDVLLFGNPLLGGLDTTVAAGFGLAARSRTARWCKIHLPPSGPVMGLLCADWQCFDYDFFSGLVYLRYAVLWQVAVLQHPFLVLLRQHRPQQPH